VLCYDIFLGLLEVSCLCSGQQVQVLLQLTSNFGPNDKSSDNKLMHFACLLDWHKAKIETLSVPRTACSSKCMKNHCAQLCRKANSTRALLLTLGTLKQKAILRCDEVDDTDSVGVRSS